MRILTITTLLLCVINLYGNAKTQDSTRTLFRSPKYSYIQWDFGYSGMKVKEQYLNGFDMSIFGVVFNEKWYVSLGVCGWVSHAQSNFLTEEPPKIDSYVFVYLNNEFLIRPKNLINFSFPLKIGYGGATGWDTLPPCTSQCIINWNFTGRDYYQHYGEFFTISPGANVFINLFKPLSLGLGMNYRFTFGLPEIMGENADFNNYSLLAFLRLKLDTEAMNERQRERIKSLQVK
ncbi:MAG: hypothetical protein ACOZCO_07300 [Bacteroidota bacterium]